MSPTKLFMGLPGYGWNWQIYDYPENTDHAYRGISNTYYAAKLWMTGGYNFTDDAPPQPMIPIVAYWDDYDKVPWALPQVYDFMEGWDATRQESPMTRDIYNRRHYLTCYGKVQNSSFDTIYVDRTGGPDIYDSANKAMFENFVMKTIPDGEICFLVADLAIHGKGIGTKLLDE